VKKAESDRCTTPIAACSGVKPSYGTPPVSTSLFTHATKHVQALEINHQHTREITASRPVML